ncbi:MAG: S26 family signal peptidase [Chloroflexi bacterium]|nr:S26 family signal peptidase [Chloroflexota bacterium]
MGQRLTFVAACLHRYFVLGDNRAESVDSRQGWTVARGDVVGKVLFSY